MVNLEQFQKYKDYYKKSDFATTLQGKSHNESKQFKLKISLDATTNNATPEICINYNNSYVELLRKNEYDYAFLSEGLITTYPINVARKQFKNYFLKKLPIELHTLKAPILNKKNDIIIDTASIIDYDDETKVAGIVSLFFPFFESDIEDAKIFVGEVSDIMHMCGYDLAEDAKFIPTENLLVNNKKIQIAKVTYEAKFFKKDIKFTEWLYHVTTIDVAKKIIRQGIVPRSQNELFKYPDRAYLFTENPVSEMVIYCMLKNMKTLKDIIVFRIKADTLKNDPLFKSDKLRFYIDPKYRTYGTSPIALYTYNTIPNRLLDNECCKLKFNNGDIVQHSQIDIKTL